MKTAVIKNETEVYESDAFHIYLEMAKRFFETEETSLYVIKGWGFSNDGSAGKVKLNFDGEVLKLEETYATRPDIEKIFANRNISGEVGFHILVRIKKEDEKKVFKLSYESKDGLKSEIFADLSGLTTESNYLSKVEKEIRGDKVSVRGWAIFNPEASFERRKEEPFELFLTDEEGQTVDCELIRECRPDVVRQYALGDETIECGFEFIWTYDENKVYTVKVGKEGNFVIHTVDLPLMLAEEREKDRRYKNILHRLQKKDPYKKADDKMFIRREGLLNYFKLVKKRYTPIDAAYQKYYEKHRASKAELKRQAAEHLDGPTFSIVVPTYNTRPDFLRDMIDSVRNQTYEKWQLCIGDGSEGNKELEAILAEYHELDPRIVYTISEKNMGISGNTNVALRLATGDYIALLDHDDLLAPEALYEVVKVILSHEDADCIYSDEDKFTDEVKDHYQPAYKPEFNRDFLRSCNYITHLFVTKKSIVDKIGEFDPNCDGAQDFDFILRCTEQAKAVYHIPKMLYHWRCHPGSTALNPGSKNYAYISGVRAVKGHCDRMGVKYDNVGQLPNTVGIYRIDYTCEPKKVSVIIIKEDGKANTTEASLKEKASFKDYEVITSKDNTAKEINAAAKQATGEYLLFLRSNMELSKPDALEKLLATCERPEVGVVGGKVYYEDDTIYHMGLILGYHGTAGRLLAGRHEIEFGQYANAVLQQNISALLSVCMMVQKDIFEAVGGFNENYNKAFYDADFCLRAGAKCQIVVEPQAEFYIHTDKYPGCDIVDEFYPGYEADEARFKTEWKDAIEKGDPYYNPHLSLKRLSYDMKYKF